MDPGDQFWLTVPVGNGLAGVEVHREGDRGWTWLKAGEFLLVQYDQPGEYTIRFRAARALVVAPLTVRVFAPPAELAQPRGHNGQAGAGGVQALGATGGASFSLGSVYAGRYAQWDAVGQTNVWVDKYPLRIYCTAVGGDCSIWPYRGSWTNTYTLAVSNETSDVINVAAGQICTLVKSCGGTQTLSPNNPSRLKVMDLILTNDLGHAPAPGSVTNLLWYALTNETVTLQVMPGPFWVTNNPAAAASLFDWTTNGVALPAPTDLTQTFFPAVGTNMVNVACHSPAPATPTNQVTTIVGISLLVLSNATDIVTNAALGACSAVVSFTLPGTEGGCPTVTVTSSPPSGATFDVGTNVVTVTAEDACGQTTNGTFKVIVRDVEPPVIDCPTNRTVSLGGTLSACRRIGVSRGEITRTKSSGRCRTRLCAPPPSSPPPAPRAGPTWW